MRLLAFILSFAIAFSINSFAQQSGCDYGVDIIVDGDEFDSEDFTWRMRATKIEGTSTKITGTARIEDSNGKPVKSYKPWTSEAISRQKTSSEYTPNLKSGNYEIIAEIIVECDDENKENDIGKKDIKIKNNDKIAKSSNKAEDDGPKSSDKEEKEKSIDTENEDKAIESKQTFSSSEDEDITIHLTANDKNKGYQTQTKSLAIKDKETVYESNSEKAKGLIMIFLLVLSVLLNIILIWKR